MDGDRKLQTAAGACERSFLGYSPHSRAAGCRMGPTWRNGHNLRKLSSSRAVSPAPGHWEAPKPCSLSGGGKRITQTLALGTPCFAPTRTTSVLIPSAASAPLSCTCKPLASFVGDEKLLSSTVEQDSAYAYATRSSAGAAGRQKGTHLPPRPPSAKKQHCLPLTPQDPGQEHKAGDATCGASIEWSSRVTELTGNTCEET